MEEGKIHYFSECSISSESDLKIVIMGEKFKLFLLLLLTVCSASKI